MLPGSRMTAAATTGPASGPRPASSQPAIGQTPRLSAARSRRNVGRVMISSGSGKRGAASFRAFSVSLPRIWRRADAGRFMPAMMSMRAARAQCGIREERLPLWQRIRYSRAHRFGWIDWPSLIEHDLFGKPVPTFPDHALEQSELLGRRPRRDEMLRRRFHAGQIEAEPLASDLKAPPDHPGDRARAGHTLAPCRIVILAAARLTNEIDDVAIAVRKIFHQPFAKQVLDLERQAKKNVAGVTHASFRYGFEDALDFGIVDGRDHRRH